MIDKQVCPDCRGHGTYKAIGPFPLFARCVTRVCDGCNGRGYVVVRAKAK